MFSAAKVSILRRIFLLKHRSTALQQLFFATKPINAACTSPFYKSKKKAF
jgi:hypothetical protein